MSNTPFRMPDNYMESLEAAVSEKINRKPSKTWSVLKPAIGLACSFALVFGMGYGVLALTGTLDRGDAAADYSETALVNNFTTSSLIDYYENLEAYGEDYLQEEEILDYLSEELSQFDISEIYAQLQ